jgi:hypothetical protein
MSSLNTVLRQQTNRVILLSELGDVVDECMQLGCDRAMRVGTRIVVAQLHCQLVKVEYLLLAQCSSCHAEMIHLIENIEQTSIVATGATVADELGQSPPVFEQVMYLTPNQCVTTMALASDPDRVKEDVEGIGVGRGAVLIQHHTFILTDV